MNRRFVSALAAYIVVILVAGLEARQSPAFVSSGAVSSPDGVLAATPTAVHLLVGRSTILDSAATSPGVDDVPTWRAMVTSPSNCDPRQAGPARSRCSCGTRWGDKMRVVSAERHLPSTGQAAVPASDQSAVQRKDVVLGMAAPYVTKGPKLRRLVEKKEKVSM